MTKEQSHLHKVYRAVFDNVCPKCGAEMYTTSYQERLCTRCNFTVTSGEMQRMRSAIGPVLAEAVEIPAHKEIKRTYKVSGCDPILGGYESEHVSDSDNEVPF